MNINGEIGFHGTNILHNMWYILYFNFDFGGSYKWPTYCRINFNHRPFLPVDFVYERQTMWLYLFTKVSLYYLHFCQLVSDDVEHTHICVLASRCIKIQVQPIFDLRVSDNIHLLYLFLYSYVKLFHFNVHIPILFLCITFFSS